MKELARAQGTETQADVQGLHLASHHILWTTGSRRNGKCFFQNNLQPAGQGLLHHSSTSRLLALIFPYLDRDATSDQSS